LQTNKLHPRKSLGQHFLYDPAIARRIVDAADLTSAEVVVELGAGRGILTKVLAEKCDYVIALEIDRRLGDELADLLQGRGEVINADFTGLSITGLVAPRGFERCVLFGNIPYNLTRHVLFSFLVDEVEMIAGAYLMLQREVGERIVSPPGGRVYGITSVILQSLYHVRPVMRVLPGSFSPPPKVESIVLEFIPLAEPIVRPEALGAFSRFVKNVFQQRRKTIQNSIKAFYAFTNQMLEELQAVSGIDLQKRPEALSKEELLLLFEKLNEVAKV